MNRLITRLVTAGLVVMASGVVALAQQALGTAFTYQGRLDEDGRPVSATADLRFRLFDDESAGNLIGQAVVSDLEVVEGLFTASVDFGATAFNGDARWVEIATRIPAGSGSFAALTPRQPLTAAPYARFGAAAPWSGLTGVPAGFADGIDNGSGDGHSLDAADGSPTDAVFVDNSGNVGIGTTAPLSSLHVAAPVPILRLQDSDNAGTGQVGLVGFRDSAGAENAWVGFGSSSNANLHLMNNRPTGNTALGAGGVERVTVTPTGNVGIGTTAPLASLHVAASVPVLRLQDADNAGLGQVGLVSFRDSSGAENGWIGFGSSSNTDFSIANQHAGGDINLFPGPGGVARTSVLEITGADLAEKFPASETLEPGMVVAIDPKNPGKLCLARGAYNSRVAGVVSGANGFSAGAVLGNLPGSEDASPVALSGRVYVWCDASNGAIEPGDLLTTSDTPGHAMKAVDQVRAHGAALGKAMTALESGCGSVLVLVTLQ